MDLEVGVKRRPCKQKSEKTGRKGSLEHGWDGVMAHGSEGVKVLQGRGFVVMVL
jgi:hypothetical protein